LPRKSRGVVMLLSRWLREDSLLLHGRSSRATLLIPSKPEPVVALAGGEPAEVVQAVRWFPVDDVVETAPLLPAGARETGCRCVAVAVWPRRARCCCREGGRPLLVIATDSRRCCSVVAGATKCCLALHLVERRADVAL
jgi:hypothetical protein